MKRLAIRSALRCALPLAVAGTVACSFSFKTGSGSPDKDGKPALASNDDAGDGASAGKPVDGGEAEPPAPEPEPEARPGDLTDTPAGDEPPPPEPSSTVAPRKTAVCRVDDTALAAMCQRVLDPIAADDVKAWVAVLEDDVVLTHPSYAKGDQRFEGRDAVKDLADKVGGVRELLHASTSDRIVGTVVNDCRNCRRAFVGFQANTRSGTVVVEVGLGQPAMVSAVEVTSSLRRPHLREHKQPGVGTLAPKTEVKTAPAAKPTAEAPPAEEKKQ